MRWHVVHFKKKMPSLAPILSDRHNVGGQIMDDSSVSLHVDTILAYSTIRSSREPRILDHGQ